MDEPEPKIIDVFICKLRRKLEIAGARGVSIDTVWGQGYTLRETEAVGRTQASLPNSIDEPVTKPAAKKLGSARRGQMSATL